MKIAAGSRGIHGLRGVAVPERDTGGAAAAPIIAAMLRGLLLGVPVGLLAGWLLFEWGDSDPPPTRAPVHAARPPAPPSGAATEGSAGGSVVAPEPGDAKEAGGGRVPPADVQDWIARLDAARDAKDWDTFSTLLQRLARAGTGPAHDKLVALMADSTLEFPEVTMHRAFSHWLLSSDAPGIAAAARVRAEMEYADARGPLQPGWLVLVARHGDAGDLAWLSSMREARGGEDAVVEALAHAADQPEVETLLVETFAGRGPRGWTGSTLGRIAGHNEALARRLITEGYGTCRASERASFMAIYGGMADASNLEDTRAFLRRQADPAGRLHAVYAVQAMRARDLPLDGLEDLVDEPARRLDEIARAPSWPHVPAGQVRAAIEYNPITWNVRTLEAIERAIERAPLVAKRQLEQLRDKVRAAVKGEGWNR